MKKKLLAIVLSVVMIAALLVPMMIASAAEPTITVSFGTIEKKTAAGKDYIVVPVEVSGNAEELFVLQYYVMSKEKLTVGKFTKGTIAYEYTDDFGDEVEIKMGTTLGENIKEITDKGYTGYNVVMDSTEGSSGLPVESGNVGTAWFELPTNPGTYTFTLEELGFIYLIKKNGTVEKANYKVNVGADATYTIEGEACDHNEVPDEEKSKDPTCTEDGAKVTKCSICGVELSREVIPAKGHGEVDDAENSKAPTCTEDGLFVTKCPVCGVQRANIVLDKLGHDLVADEENSKAPDCENAGVEAKKCTRCDYTEKKDIPALGHDWDDGVVAEGVKCGETADITYTCTVCKETKVETGAVVEHIMVADPDNSKEADCENDGVKATKCSREGCDHTEKETIPALGHDFDVDYKVTKVPTATEEGAMEAECANGCGEKDVIVLKKLATEIKDGNDYIKADEAILPEDLDLIPGDAEEKDGKYTLEFTFGSEIIADLKGEVEVGLDLEGMDEEFEKLEVYKVNADGTTTLISEVKDGKLVFKADLEGKYVLSFNEIDDNKKPAPETDDAMNTVIFAVVALIAVAGLVVVGKKRFAL